MIQGVPGTHSPSDPMTAVTERLVARYGQTVTAEVIRAAVEGHTRRFASASIRTYLPILVERAARHDLTTTNSEPQ
jgi:hypothetical protein